MTTDYDKGKGKISPGEKSVAMISVLRRKTFYSRRLRRPKRCLSILLLLLLQARYWEYEWLVREGSSLLGSKFTMRDILAKKCAADPHQRFHRSLL